MGPGGVSLVLLAAGLAAGRECRNGKCRPTIHCAGDFEDTAAMEEHTCEQRPGRQGLCCQDVKKGARAPPPKAPPPVRPHVPVGLTENTMRREEQKQGRPAPLNRATDGETQSQQMFTRSRQEYEPIREAAVKMAGMFSRLERAGNDMKSKGSSMDAGNSDVMRKICPWTSSAKPSCGSETEKYRTVDGSCNNIKNPLYGMSGTPQQRIADPSAYPNILSAYRKCRDCKVTDQPRVAASGRELPSARLVQTSLFTKGDSSLSKGLSVLFMQMGQFIDHDLTHGATRENQNTKGIIDDKDGTTCCQRDSEDRPWVYPSPEKLEECERSEKCRGCIPIEIPSDDQFWGDKGRTCITLKRTQPSPSMDGCTSRADRFAMNALTHWLDASNIYGSTTKEAGEVRDSGSHLLRMSKPRGHARELLPTCQANHEWEGIEACELLCEKEPERKCSFAGDFRSNEQIGLTSMHTIWVREHNRIATKLKALNRRWDGERVFQETRRIVTAEWQNIVYKEWLPIALGPRYMKRFSLFPLKPNQGYTEDYDPSIVPQINLEFSGAAFRFGHSMIPDVFQIRPPGGRGRSESMKLRDILFNPSILQNEGMVDGVLNAQAQLTAPGWDPEFGVDLVDHLFETETDGGMDLISMNIQRGREQGIHGYNTYRELCGYGRAETFDDLAKGDYLSRGDIRAMDRIYDSVDDIDLFVGGTLEKPYRPKAILGPAFACIIGDQFSRFKKGDRFWFENGDDRETRFELDQLDSIRGTSMARILCDNTGIEEIQPMAFRSPGGNINSLSDCTNINEGINLDLWAGPIQSF